jgi:hypothetical protein
MFFDIENMYTNITKRGIINIINIVLENNRNSIEYSERSNTYTKNNIGTELLPI